MNRYVLLLALFFVLLIRFTTLDDYALTDTTEARYGEVTRVMVEARQWMMPQLALGEPFWAKPPLSFWQGATSIKLLGVSEFALRLPAFINFLGVLLLTYLFSRSIASKRIQIIAPLIASSTATGFIVSGAVMTDHAMLFGVTVCFYSFWMLVNAKRKHWAYLFTFGLVTAFLAKGPIAIVLSMVPVLGWVTLTKQWGQVWSLAPVTACLVLFLLLGLPWFLIAEHISPGYLHYYFVGEHFYRYLIPGWEGDLYGTAHNEPYGKIWLFAIAAYFPWIFVVALVLLNLFRKTGRLLPLSAKNKLQLNEKSLPLYLILWIIWPLVFFTVASNILHTYVLTGLPAFAVLAALLISKNVNDWSLGIIAVSMPIVLVVAFYSGLDEEIEAKSQRSSLAYVAKHYPDADIIYSGSIPHSARFYSRGNATLEKNIFNLKRRLISGTQAVVFVTNGIEFKEGTNLTPILALTSRKYQGFLLDAESKDSVSDVEN